MNIFRIKVYKKEGLSCEEVPYYVGYEDKMNRLSFLMHVLIILKTVKL
jgi:hypothetical protein